MQAPPCTAHATSRDNCSHCLEMRIAYEEGYRDGDMDRRRERIAIAALAAILANSDPAMRDGTGTIHGAAVWHADQLIAALDAKTDTDGATK